MHCLDATFIIDFLAGDQAAVGKAREWTEVGEPLAVPAPVLAETLLGAYFRGGPYLRDALAFLDVLEVLPVEDQVAGEAGRMGAEQLHRGVSVSLVDLLIAAASKLSGSILVTRDAVFAQIPGLAVESY